MLGALAASQANAAVDADFQLFLGGGYNPDGTPFLGAYASSGTTPWTDSVRFPGYLVASPGGEDRTDWFPLGYDEVYWWQYAAFGARLTSAIDVGADGNYNFGTYSDDGSALYVDDVLVVNNGYDHGPAGKFALTHLSAGPHQLRVDFYENGEGQSTFSAYFDPVPALDPTPVPEPSTYLAGLSALGMLGVFGWRNRR